MTATSIEGGANFSLEQGRRHHDSCEDAALVEGDFNEDGGLLRREHRKQVEEFLRYEIHALKWGSLIGSC